jgi:hypothetical protein
MSVSLDRDTILKLIAKPGFVGNGTPQVTILGIHVVSSGTNDAFSIQGASLQGSSANGPGLRCEGNTQCEVIECEVTGSGNDGISIDTADLIVRRSTIYNTDVGLIGGYAGANFIIANTIIRGNNTGVSINTPGSVRFLNNTVYGNTNSGVNCSGYLWARIC